MSVSNKWYESPYSSLIAIVNCNSTAKTQTNSKIYMYPIASTITTAKEENKMPNTIKELASFRDYVICLIDGRLAARSKLNNTIIEAKPSGFLLLEEWMFMMCGDTLHVGEMKALPTKEQQAEMKRKKIENERDADLVQMRYDHKGELYRKEEAINKKYAKKLR